MYQHARAISDNSRRDFCQPAKSQQAIGGNSRRDFHPQVKSQLAIDASRRRAMLQQQHSILRRCDDSVL